MPFWQSGSVTDVGDMPELKSNPPCVYKMSLSPKFFPHTNMSELQRSALMRRFYLTGLQEMRVYGTYDLKALQDCYPV